MMKCKIRITKDITDLFPQYQPKVGKVYDAEYMKPTNKRQRAKTFCVIGIAGKRIVIREGEFEIVGC